MWNYYTKCGEVFNWFGALTSQMSYPTLKIFSWHTWSFNCQGCTIWLVITSPPLHQHGCHNYGWNNKRRVGMWANWAKCLCYTKSKFRIHVMQLKFMSCFKIFLCIPYKRFTVIIMHVKNLMVCSLSPTLGSSMWNELAS